jgi:hypothetical protein
MSDAIPDGKAIGYQCENGHERAGHDINHAAPEGKQCVCEECGGLLTRKLIPRLHCRECDNTWAFAGDSDRPTCPECLAKNTVPVAEQ